MSSLVMSTFQCSSVHCAGTEHTVVVTVHEALENCFVIDVFPPVLLSLSSLSVSYLSCHFI